MSRNKFYIYGLYKPIQDSIFDECFYIGKGSGNRLKSHFKKYEKGYNPHKDLKIEKYDCYSKIIKSDLSEKVAYELEEFIINEIGLHNLTNLTTGGDGTKSGKNHPWYGESHTEKAKKEISKSKEGTSLSKEHKNKISESHKGKSLSKSHINSIIESKEYYSHSSKTKEKISKSNKGEGGRNKLTKKEASEIKWLSKNSELTQREISNVYNISRQNVSCIKNEKSWKHIKSKKPDNYE